MKQLYGAVIIIITAFAALHFDSLVIFLLSGSIPGIHITLSPSMSMAVMIAGGITIYAVLRYRHAVYLRSLELYDKLLTEQKTPGETPSKSPKHRYGQL